MELVSLGKEMLHAAAEQAASCKLGQSALRQVDRALWVVEKCSKWSVPVDRDERPQADLVRPLPWLVFLPMLVLLRLAREAVSLVNLVLGKPPLRSTDVVMYIQSKRRYLRTLKYQGSRAMRSRSSTQSWYAGARKLFEFTMCFRNSQYGNNNTTQISNNDEILVVKRSKRGRHSSGEAAPHYAPESESAESTMERLITKMMADMDADSDDDSSYTLTNATSVNSINTVDSEHEHEIIPNGASTPTSVNGSLDETSVNVNDVTVTRQTTSFDTTETNTTDVHSSDSKENSDVNNKCNKGFMSMSQTEDLSIINSEMNDITNYNKRESLSMINNERKMYSVNQSTKINHKIANGRAVTVSRVPKKSKGQLSERRDSDVPLVRISANDSP